ncbi:MAG: thiamine phosphate synthase [Thiotrichales bacterium]
MTTKLPAVDDRARWRGLYAITRECDRDPQRWLNDIEAALRGGARYLQYRDKRADLPRRLEEARALRALTSKHGVYLIINDDLELAEAVGADGLHLGRDDASLAVARGRLGPEAIIGVSCYAQLERAIQAEREGASYVAFGSFFPSPTKPQAERADTSLLAAWRMRPTPVCAIGGITLENARDLVTAGADMVAVISALWDSANIEETARSFALRSSG